MAVAGATAAVLPASPAHAAASGLGFSASWSYYLDDTYFFKVTLPGAEILGHVIDNGLSRVAGVSLADTAVDGLCAAGTTGFMERKVCDGQPHLTFSFVFVGGQHVALSRDPVNGPRGRSVSLSIPSSVDDPELRLTGTGASWSFYTDRDYQFDLRRQGVHVVGFGSRTIVLGAVEHTGGAGTCAEGNLFDFSTGATDFGFTCDPGGFDTLAMPTTGRFVNAEACVSPSGRCVDIVIPPPF